MTSPAKPTNPRFQFSLRQAFLAMSGVCVFFGSYAANGMEGIYLFCMAIPLTLLAYGALWKRPQVVLWATVLGMVVFPYLALTLIIEPKETYRAYECQNNLRNIALAVHHYHAENNILPARTITSNSGQRLLSWRVTVLPFLECQPLYNRFYKTQPWNSPTNFVLIQDRDARYFHCPSDPTDTTNTSYIAIAGPDTFWPDNPIKTFSEVRDGTSNTLMLVEQHNTGIAWSEPRDLDAKTMSWEISPASGNGISSRHGPSITNFDGTRRYSQRAGANVVFADGSVRKLSPNTDPEIIKRLVNRHDGQPTGLDD